MSLEQALKTTISHLRRGLLNNEAQVKQSAILPILRELDWDDADPEVFMPEYSAGPGLVDYALLDRGRPLIFIEAKRIGAMDAGGEEQLFGYASNKGVPLLVLTEGNFWDFYLSMASGVPSERRFYRLELQLEHKITEYTDFLEEHLRKGRVVSGEARLNAEKRHASNRDRERAFEVIPNAWKSLLLEPNEMIRDLLTGRVESECGIKPELDDVEAFLRNPRPAPLRPNPELQPPTLSTPPATSRPRSSSQPERSKIIGFVLGEEKINTGASIRTLTEILITFQRRDPEFMGRFARRTASTNRNLVSKNRFDLYKKSHLVYKNSKELENGWWLGTNLDKKKIITHIETACTAARIEFGTQLILIER